MVYFFFFNDTATTEIYTLSLHDALPISPRHRAIPAIEVCWPPSLPTSAATTRPCESDRKSTRLNSSHSQISYAVFCLKKKTHPLRQGRGRHRRRLHHHIPDIGCIRIQTL